MRLVRSAVAPFLIACAAGLVPLAAADAIVVNADSTVDIAGQVRVAATMQALNVLATHAPIAVTAATTLTTTAAGKLHTIAGTSADYAITLPAASAVPAGSLIGFAVSPWASANKQYAITPAGTELIDGRGALKLIHTNTLVLMSSATGWVSLVKTLDTSWVPCAPTINAVTTAPTKGATRSEKAAWRRQGANLEYLFSFEQTSAGTAGSGIYLYPIPIGSIDTSLCVAGTGAAGA